MTQTELENEIKAWISRITHSEIDADGDFFVDYGLDSLMFAEMISHLETKFDFQIDFSDLVDWETIKHPSGLVNFMINQLK